MIMMLSMLLMKSVSLIVRSAIVWCGACYHNSFCPSVYLFIMQCTELIDIFRTVFCPVVYSSVYNDKHTFMR